MTDDQESKNSPQASRQSMPAGWKWFFWIASVAVLILFLTPAFFVGKYYMVDAPGETASLHGFGDPAAAPKPAELPPLQKALSRSSPNNIPLQAAYAQKSPDAGVRLLAVRSLTSSLTMRGAVWHPMESMIGKSTLAELAEHDKDDAVKAAARDGLLRVARGGAVVTR